MNVRRSRIRAPFRIFPSGSAALALDCHAGRLETSVRYVKTSSGGRAVSIVSSSPATTQGSGPGRVRVSFLMPAYNEAATIVEVLDAVARLDLDKQIVVVDDGSTDGTADLVERWNGDAILVRQPHRGKGAAVRTAIPHADGEICVIQDTDLEYDPVDVPQLIQPIERGAADVVFGSRLRGGRPQRAYLFWHLVGNRFLSLLTN